MSPYPPIYKHWEKPGPQGGALKTRITACVCLLAHIEGDLHYTKKRSRLNRHYSAGSLRTYWEAAQRLASLMRSDRHVRSSCSFYVSWDFNRYSVLTRTLKEICNKGVATHFVKIWLLPSQFKDMLRDRSLQDRLGWLHWITESKSLRNPSLRSIWILWTWLTSIILFFFLHPPFLSVHDASLIFIEL